MSEATELVVYEFPGKESPQPEPNSLVVEGLEELLKRARDGEIQGYAIAISLADEDGEYQPEWSIRGSYWMTLMLGTIERLKVMVFQNATN